MVLVLSGIVDTDELIFNFSAMHPSYGQCHGQLTLQILHRSLKKKCCDPDASTKRPLPVLILPFKTSLNDFIPDNHEFQVKTTLV